MPTAKPKIEDIHVQTGGGVGGQPTIHWNIGDRRFHVWLDRHGQPEDVVHSNAVVPNKAARRDEHRSLDRASKVQSAIWDQVWAVVQRDGLIEKCRAADIEKRDLQRRYQELRTTIASIEQEVLDAFRRGEFALQPSAFESIYMRWLFASAELRSLPAMRQEAA
ncbi:MULTISPECIES: hypothetical protein [unclassified Bradyrhizobium]|uniref:hypothetical protein n=1 Tax=unclassified Bradyrhizobium TaxID=2631580 RepID=UPI001FF876FA|nr:MULTISPECIES: hypothetical protein [unclassified Bradyrhizobium]MCK1536832.1 hypothetical protein [Bradyrhizobium sp. 176]MCK1560135.1 hypothetical protein [Bradyrhizobium sp. 171]